MSPGAPQLGLEAEQTILGALLVDSTALARVNGLRAAHFAREDHRKIFAAVLDCAEDSGAVDAALVAGRIARNTGDGELSAYVAALAGNMQNARNVEHYAGLVKEQAQRRAIAALGAELVEHANSPAADLAALRREAEGRLAEIQPERGHEWGNALDLAALATREPERPKEIMLGLPCGYATLSAGHGGAGKSTIELTRAVCIAAGVPFFGLPVERRRVLYLSCEDRESVLHWRLSRICAYLGVDLAELAGWLHVVDLVGRDAVLWERDPRTGYTLTSAFDRLADLVREYQAEVLFIDGTADTFGGNENARGEVKRYVNATVSLIAPERGAVVLIAHIAKATAANATTTEGYSGSTSWHNSARARWYLYPETAQGEGERTGDLILELQKSNLGRADQQIRFRWDDDAHLFVGRLIEPEGSFERGLRDRTERDGILAAFRACAAAQPPVVIPAAMTGPRTAHHVLRNRPEFPETLRSGKPGVRKFWQQIEDLRQMQAIEETSYRRANRHSMLQLVITAEEVRRCA